MTTGTNERTWPPVRRKRSRKKNLWILYLLNFVLLVVTAVPVFQSAMDSRQPEILPSVSAETIARDTTPPVISGVQDLHVSIGDTIAYLNEVTASDDMDPNPALSVDSSMVDLSTPGEYLITYFAKDATGNCTSAAAWVTVSTPAETEAEEDHIQQAVHEVLDSILTDDMDTRQQVQAIYTWAKETLSYRDGTVHEDYVQTGYETLVSGGGDCYGFFAVTKLMFEALNIPNIDVRKVKQSSHDSDHFWSMVSVDNEQTWYHFDATPRIGQTEELCLVTDTFLDSFDTYHNGCHNRDRSLYPATPAGW